MNKFLIVANNRCGYHYFRSLALSHYELLYHNEMWAFLNSNRNAKKENPYQGIDKIEFSPHHQDAVDYFDEIFRVSLNHYPKKKVGFKLSPLNFTEDPDLHTRLWRHINAKKIKLIFLDRKDKFLVYLSNELVRMKGNRWFNQSYRGKIDFSIEDYITKSDASKKYWDLIKTMTTDCESLNITYEDLCDEPQSIMNQFYDFLKVDKRKIDWNDSCITSKQMDQPASFYLENPRHAFRIIGKNLLRTDIDKRMRYYLNMAYRHAPKRKKMLFV